jgi:hypothetical protein
VKYLPNNKAFLDTTVLADALMKPNGEGQVARDSFKKFSECLIPQYAIKEFKAGVLRNYVWLHTKAVLLASYGDVVHSLTKMWAKRNLSATALRAFADFENSISKRMPSDLGSKFPGQTIGQIQKAELETWLRTLIFRSWRKRHKIGTVLRPLDCYFDTDLKLRVDGVIDDKPVRCGVEDCCLRVQLVVRKTDIAKMLAVFDELPTKAETGKRKEALKHLYRTPNRYLTEKQCVSLGDAVFALQCPSEATLLTTNIADHLPLGRALGVVVKKPSEV